jgi:hypothetical protein
MVSAGSVGPWSGGIPGWPDQIGNLVSNNSDFNPGIQMY